MEPSPGRELAKECRKIFKQCELRIKIVERSGTSIKRLLTKSDPLSKGGCAGEECDVCNHSTQKICKVRESVYEILCTECDTSYVGETSRSLQERFKEHLLKYRRKDKDSVFYRHSIENHHGVQPDLFIRILARCPGDPTLRQATEATYIKALNPSLNGKCEFGNMNISRNKKKTSGT